LGNLGESRVGAGKSGKISETRKDREKVTMEGLFTAFSSPRLDVRNPHPKLQSLLSQERVKLQTANLAVHRNKCPLKILEKSERGRIQGLAQFFECLYYVRNG